MKQRTLLQGMFIAFLLSMGAALAQDADSVLFPTPDILKDNVAFWKKIYTEVSLKQGLLHDREYPLVIFKVFDLDAGGRSRGSVETEKRKVIAILDHLADQSDSTWTAEEKTIAQLYKDHAPANAMHGAKERIRFQLGQKERFRQGLERSTMYLDTIRAIFTQYKIPHRLAFLPHVESSFNYEAYSKVGAAGLWQFMRGTGKLFLKINYLVDERRDPISATFAAAKLLRQNFDELQAWPLAITAYNHGLNGMKRAEEVTGSKNIADVIAKYESPSFQFASKNFYACFLAASEIAKNPSAYFSDLQFMQKREYKTVPLQSFMKPSVLSQFLKVPQKTLMEYNLSLRPVVFLQQKQIPAGFVMRIPADNAVAANAEKLLAAVPDSLKSQQAERSGYYNVQEGDNLQGIAARLGVTVAQLIQENNINRRNTIYAGQVLRVPTTLASAAPAPASAVADTQPVQVAMATPQENKHEKTVTTQSEKQAAQQSTVVDQMQNPPGPVPPPAPVETTQAPLPQKPAQKAIVPHVPTPAQQPKREAAPQPAQPIPDSLKEISQAKAVVVPVASAGAKPLVIPNFDVSVYNLELTMSPVGNTAKIKVSVDETIGHFADWLGVPIYHIRELNHFGSRAEIRINQKITIPADQDLLAKFVKARLEYHMALEEDFYSKYKVTDTRARLLKKGDNLWNICINEEQIPMWLFAKYNKDLDLSSLMPGTKLWIPVVEEKTEQDIALDSGAPIGIYQLFYEQSKKGMQTQIKRIP